MSGYSSAQCAKPDDMTPVILLNGLSVKTTYMANCRLCLGANFGKRSTTIVEERFSVMLTQLFPFPIPNQIGLPMNVCSKCYKGIEIFYVYRNQVQANQKTLAATLVLQDTYLKSGNSKSQKYKDDKKIDVDMQCETIEDNDENDYDPLVQSSDCEDTQTHFVSVAAEENRFFEFETDVLECEDKIDIDRVEEAPLVIEAVLPGDEEYLESADEYDRLSDHNYSQPEYAKHQQYSLRQTRYYGQTSSQADPIAENTNTVNKLEKPKDDLTFLDCAINANDTDSYEDSNDETFGWNIAKRTRSCRNGARNTIKQRNASKSAEHFVRAQNSSLFQLEPISTQAELQEFNRQLEDPGYMDQVTVHLLRETGLERSLHLMHSAIDILFTLEFFVTCSWSGVGIPHSKIPFKKHSKIVELFSVLGAEDGNKLPAHTMSKYFKCKFNHAKRRLREFKNIRLSAPRQGRRSTKILKIKLVADC